LLKTLFLKQSLTKHIKHIRKKLFIEKQRFLFFKWKKNIVNTLAPGLTLSR